MTTVDVRVLCIDVPGVPRPKGSKRILHNRQRNYVFVVESCRELDLWIDRIVIAARNQAVRARWSTVHGPVRVELDFAMPEPKHKPKTRTRPSVQPDIDKLVRAVFDALTAARIWKDDAQVVEFTAALYYPTDTRSPLTTPGVRIRIGTVL
jgi:Holliday junction resolvase RusA-like endonuclease